MFNIITFLFALLFVQFTSAQSLIAEIKENQEFFIPDETLVFLGHSTSFWDSGFKTQAAVKELIQISKKYNKTILATAASHMLKDDYLSSLHYFKKPDIDILVESRAGQHALNAPQLKNIFIAGGNLGRCLCEGIRDLVSSFSQSAQFKSVNLYLIRDGVYDGYTPFSPMREEAVVDFTKNFFTPSFNCPLQNWNIKKRIPIHDAALNLYYDEKLMETFDLEPKDEYGIESLKKTINVHFIEVKDVESYLINL